MFRMLSGCLQWLCPCLFDSPPKEQRIELQMITIPLATRIYSYEEVSKDKAEGHKYHTPPQDSGAKRPSINERCSDLQRPKRQSNYLVNSIVDSDKSKASQEYLSFKKTDSLIKRNFRVVRVSGRESVTGLYESLAQLTKDNDSDYKNLIDNYTSYVEMEQGDRKAFRESELIQLERMKRRLLIEAQNQIDEFSYFTTDLDIIFESKEIGMTVELKKEEMVFENKACCILCHLVCPAISIGSLLKILNSAECQHILNSFSDIKGVCISPDIILSATKHNPSLNASSSLNILKYVSLLSEEEPDGGDKMYVVEIETAVNMETLSSHAKDFYRRVIRIARNAELKLVVEMYSEESFALKPEIRAQDYYKNIYSQFAKYFVRKLKLL